MNHALEHETLSGLMDRIPKSWRGPLLLLLLGAGGLALFWVLAQLYLRHSGLSFLPTARGAEWVLYPKPIEGTRHEAVPLTATFQRTFVLESVPSQAHLTLRAFRTAAVNLNGHPVEANEEVRMRNDEARSRKPNFILKTLSFKLHPSHFLQPGTNLLTVWVTNSAGPPALWLRLDAGPLSLGTDAHWQATLAGSDWQPARLASRPPPTGPDNPLFDSETTLASLHRAWPLLALLAAVSLLLAFGMMKAEGRGQKSGFIIHHSPFIILFLVLLARAALFLHNAPLLPRNTGFDAEAHEDYVQFILNHHALPLPGDGWEMYQPPLYYSVGALVLSAGGYSLSDDDATFLLRAVNGVAGLLHCWLALLCLRLLFPNNRSAQIAGLLLVAFLPPHLYLPQYVTNEPLTGLFITAALYCFLRTQNSNHLWLYAALGAALGAAMLTKVSALIPTVVLGTAVACRLFRKSEIGMQNAEVRGQRVEASKQQSGGRMRTSSFILLTSSFLLVCSWHYLRIWAHTGRPLVGNWESGWWQDPGYRTTSFLTGFGHALTHPLFSAAHSFADGFYSTLWGDGLASGAARLAARPPWNYDLMNAAALLSLALVIIFVLGLAFAVYRHRTDLRFAICDLRLLASPWMVLLILVALFGLAVLFMSFRVPSYAQVKAFYAFPALFPFAALFSLAWTTLSTQASSRHSLTSILHPLLFTLLLFWSLTTYTAFWIRPTNAETHLVRGLCLADHQRDAEALDALSQALQADAESRRSGAKPLLVSSRAEAHFRLGGLYEDQNRPADALREYREALSGQPDFPGALNNLAWLLTACPEATLRNGPEAVRLAEQACALTHSEVTVYLGTLAAAYAEAGRFPDALATAERAVAQARATQQNNVVRRNEALLQLYRAGKPFHETR